jgi:SAM-dependent methyltransferase
MAVPQGDFLQLNFPIPPGCSEAPVWMGDGFLVDGRRTSILSYTVGPAGWSDGLTEIHEEEAGDDHYIDCASRDHAVQQLGRWLERPGSASIMEIGCSSGYLLRALRYSFPNSVIVGADIVRAPLERLWESAAGLPLLQFDLTKCPWSDNCFDALVLLNVLEHIEDDVEAVRQALRILKPGGVAIIEVPSGPGLYDIYDEALLHFRRYRMRELLQKLTSVGFEIADRSHLGFFLYPAFGIVKKRNRTRLSASAEVKQKLVRENIRLHRSSRWMHTLMKIESRLRQRVYFPFGIRCLVVARKPAIVQRLSEPTSS